MIDSNYSGHTYVGEWEPLPTSRGLLRAHLFEQTDGRKRLYFVPEGEGIRRRERSRNVTRIGFRDYEYGSVLLGVTVEKKMRGMKLGEALVEYFRREAERNGAPFLGTGVINKPLMALTLSRAGLVPISTDVLVEILPTAVGSEFPDPPKVHMVRDEHGDGPLTDSSEGGRFYEVVDPEVVAAEFPINSPAMTVAIHTPYLPPTSQ